MSARLVMAPTSPAWDTLDCLKSVEQCCRDLIHSAPASDTGIFDAAAHAADYHLQAGGRRIRARLALDAAYYLGLSAGDAIAIASTCELLHNASLVHDDLQDRDPGRRGNDAVWKAFGAETAICTGDLLLSSAYAALAKLDQTTFLPEMLSLVHARTQAAIRGQTADVSHRTHPVGDLATYLQIVARKSGALLSLPLELALTAAGLGCWNASACKAAEAFAIGYQIADDIDDLEKDAGGNDAAPVLNVVLLLQSGSNDQEVVDLVRRRCVELARDHLRIAAASATSLPHQCGSLLAQLAVDLSSRL